MTRAVRFSACIDCRRVNEKSITPVDRSRPPFSFYSSVIASRATRPCSLIFRSIGRPICTVDGHTKQTAYGDSRVHNACFFNSGGNRHENTFDVVTSVHDDLSARATVTRPKTFTTLLTANGQMRIGDFSFANNRHYRVPLKRIYASQESSV